MHILLINFPTPFPKGIRILSAMNKIKLNQEHKDARFQWCVEKEKWVDEWRPIAWTDEVTIQNHANFKSKVFTKNKRTDGENFQQSAGITNKFKVNVWGYISYNKCEIYRIDGKFDRASYMKILRDQGAVDSMLQGGVTKIQQDNLRTHHVPEVTSFIDSKLLEIMIFPVYSPDIAPIENIWGILKRMVHDKLMTKQVIDEDGLWDLIQECWNKIPIIVIQHTIDSMPKRCELVIKNCGEISKN